MYPIHWTQQSRVISSPAPGSNAAWVSRCREPSNARPFERSTRTACPSASDRPRPIHICQSVLDRGARARHHALGGREDLMIVGGLIAESLRVGSVLEGVTLTVTKV